MKIKVISLKLIILCSFSALFAQTRPEKYFETGNNFYAQGNYEQALEAYQKVLASGLESGELLFNMGNAYYRTGKFTDAVYYFEKAKLLIPDDEDLQHNLELANLQIQDKVQPMPEFFLTKKTKALITSKPADFWAFTSIVTFILMLGLFLIYLFSKKRNLRQLSFFSALFLLIFAATTFVFSQKQKNVLQAQNSGIIFSPSVYVKSSPDSDATELFSIHEGLKVEILDESGDWLEIRLADGKKGWMQKDGLKRI